MNQRSDIPAVIQQARTLEQNGLAHEGIALLTEHLAFDEQPALLSERGVIYGSIGQHRAALADTRSAVAQDPHNPYVLLNYGLALTMSDRNEEALQQFERVLAIAPAHVAAIQQASLAALAIGQHERACGLAAKAIALASKDPLSYHCMGLAHEAAGDLIAAISHLSQAIALAPSEALSIFERGRVRLRLGEYELAAKDLSHVSDLFWLEPKRGVQEWKVLFLLGRAYEKQCEFGKAIGCYSLAQAVCTDPTTSPVIGAIALALSRRAGGLS